MLKNRPPYDAEVDAEVAKEYERLQEQKRKVRTDHGREIEAVRTRVMDLEGTVSRLGEDVAASHKRMEEMMQKILLNQSHKEGHAGEETTEPSSSLQMLDTSALTSTTVEATTLVHQPDPPLTTMGVADAPLPSVDNVSIDVAEDAATFVTVQNPTLHINSDTIIASIIGDILDDEGKKCIDPQATEETLEPQSEDVPLNAPEEVNEGHPEVEGIADVLEENANPEQVTSSKNHHCPSCMEVG